MTKRPATLDLSLDQHLLHCALCASGDDACAVGSLLGTAEFDRDQDVEAELHSDHDGLNVETLAEHRARLHDPRDLDAEPCCPDCCDCQDAPGD